MTYRVTFWGTRGSIPTPGPDTARYGGNTPCLSVEGPAGDLVILDAGTGIRKLGRLLEQTGETGLRAEILLSHTHWDHIQGLPFFAPFFRPGNQITIRGAPQGGVPLADILRQQMHPIVFPVPLDAVAADLAVEHVEEGSFEIGEFRVDALRIRHPGTALAYRLHPRSNGLAIVYVTDNELDTSRDYGEGPHWHDRFLEFVAKADLLVHDAMYTPEQIVQFAGWGHSSYAEAVGLAREAGVRRLVLFHHSPEHSDQDLDEIAARARAEAGDVVEVFAAQEGLTLTL
jgi:phosphoribosyl 1,2-cyclic phosphodiesterase